MSIQEILSQKQELYYKLIEFIDNNEYDENEYQDFIKSESQIILKDHEHLSDFLYLILQISRNHQRNEFFFTKIEKILLNFKENIIQNIPNNDIFKIFQKNRRILLFLLNNGILTFDKKILISIDSENKNNKNIQFLEYFSPEIDRFLNSNCDISLSAGKKIVDQIITNYDLQIFEENRLKGENDSYLCSLIRNDSIEEFIIMINKKNIPKESIIKTSIFETNSFLLKTKNTTLIEYAAFFGSLQIFQFLRMNNVELKPSLWLYAIHGRNPEIIHLLEEDHIDPIDKSYNECLKESIKCHHNELVSYIINNLLNNNGQI